MYEETFLLSMKRNIGECYHMRGSLRDLRKEICLIIHPLVIYIHGVVVQIKWYFMEGTMHEEYK